MTATQETALQLAHCAELHKQFEKQRRRLSHESAVQAAANRRLFSRLEMAEHAHSAA